MLDDHTISEHKFLTILVCILIIFSMIHFSIPNKTVFTCPEEKNDLISESFDHCLAATSGTLFLLKDADLSFLNNADRPLISIKPSSAETYDVNTCKKAVQELYCTQN